MPAPAEGVRTRLGTSLVARELSVGLQRESGSMRAGGLEPMVSLSGELWLMGHCQARQGLRSGQGTLGAWLAQSCPGHLLTTVVAPAQGAERAEGPPPAVSLQGKAQQHLPCEGGMLKEIPTIIKEHVLKAEYGVERL